MREVAGGPAGIEHLKPGDVVLVRVRHFQGSDSRMSDRHGTYEVRPARVLQVYRRFCTVVLRRGDELVRESPFYEDIVALNPEGIEAPVLEAERSRKEQPREVVTVGRGPKIPERVALEALRLKETETLSISELGERLGVEIERARSLVRAGRRIRDRMEAHKSGPINEGDAARAAAHRDEPRRTESAAEPVASVATPEPAEREAVVEKAPAPGTPATEDAPEGVSKQAASDQPELVLRAIWDELRALRRALARHVHLPDGRAVIVEEIEEAVERG